MPGPRRLRPPLFVFALAAVLAAAACSPAGPLEVEVSGRLLDVDDAPVAGAVVFVPDGVGSSAVFVAQAGACQAPSETHVAKTCTDAEGRFTLRLLAPSSGMLKLVLERLYWRAEAVVDLSSRPAGQPVEVPDTRFAPLEPDEELDRAIRFAVPGLKDFSTIRIQDDVALKVLDGHAGGGAEAEVSPATIQLPIRQPDGTIETITWLAYHRNLRAEGIEDCILDADTLETAACEPLVGPSLTFQGLPRLSDAELERLRSNLDDFAKALENEEVYQLSVLALVGGELDASYYGLKLKEPHTPSTLQGLRGLLGDRYGEATARRLLTDDGPNYLLYNQIDLEPRPVDDVEDHGDEDDLLSADAGAGDLGPAWAPDLRVADRVGPTQTTSTVSGTLTPFMAADPTLYDAFTGKYLVSDYHGRVEAATNRQDMFFWALQVHPVEPPTFPPPLPAIRNGFSVRTVIAGYRRLSPLGQARFSFPAGPCGQDPSLLSRYREFSPAGRLLPGEYWVWWTGATQYGWTLGCGTIGGFGQAARNGGAAWVHLNAGTLEVVGSVLMHETGHLLNGRHDRAGVLRCRLFGALPIGVEGPTLMTAVLDPNLALCFTPTPQTSSLVRNTSLVAAHLARFLP